MVQKEQLSDIVGAANVIFDEAKLQEYAADISFINRMRPMGIVRPRDAKEVYSLVKLAGETQTPLVPISSGAPHLRGDTVPGVGGAIVVDLTNLKQIIQVDRPRRVAMVEAGVTFAELIPAVYKEGLRLNMPLLPRHTKSVVGSMLEREPVMMPAYQWDISDPLACVEVIFGNGEEFRTGQAAGPGTIEEQWAAGAVQKAPYGPGTASLHRLIQGSQGTIGVVTWASLRCELLPQLEEPFFVESAELEKLLQLVHWLVRLRLVNECFIINKTTLNSIRPKAPSIVNGSGKNAFADWVLFYNVAGYEYYPEERISYQVQNIAGITQRIGLESVKTVSATSADEFLKSVRGPSPDPYWKTRGKGACQEIFFLTNNERLEKLVGVMNGAAEKYGYPVAEMAVYLQPSVQNTACHCEFDLFYDPQNPQEKGRVRELTREATRELLSNGAFFSRPYGETAREIMNRDAASTAMLARLKKIFDPNNIMNPGRLGF